MTYPQHYRNQIKTQGAIAINTVLWLDNIRYGIISSGLNWVELDRPLEQAWRPDTQVIFDDSPFCVCEDLFTIPTALTVKT